MSEKTTPVYYVISTSDPYMNKEGLIATARMKCSKCGEKDLNTIWFYCPNCGREFEKVE